MSTELKFSFDAAAPTPSSGAPKENMDQKIKKIKDLIFNAASVTNLRTAVQKLYAANVGKFIGFDLGKTIDIVYNLVNKHMNEVLIVLYYQELAGGNINLAKLDRLEGKDVLKKAADTLALTKKAQGAALGPDVMTLSRLTAVLHPWSVVIRQELGLTNTAGVSVAGFEGSVIFNSPLAAYYIPRDPKYDALWKHWIDKFAKVHHDKVRDKKRVPLLDFNEGIQELKRDNSFIDPKERAATADAWLARIPILAK